MSLSQMKPLLKTAFRNPEVDALPSLPYFFEDNFVVARLKLASDCRAFQNTRLFSFIPSFSYELFSKSSTLKANCSCHTSLSRPSPRLLGIGLDATGLFQNGPSDLIPACENTATNSSFTCVVATTNSCLAFYEEVLGIV
jgi:hypothetical protein